MKRSSLLKLYNFYPPYLGAGIRIKNISDDLRRVEVELRLHWWNRNYVGTHFGGSIYSMTDPFYMVMLIENLGPEYIVWDKAADIHFKKPGRGCVRAIFTLSQDQIDQIKKQADEQYKVEPQLTVQVFNEQNEIVAEVLKTLYVRRKDHTSMG